MNEIQKVKTNGYLEICHLEDILAKAEGIGLSMLLRPWQ